MNARLGGAEPSPLAPSRPDGEELSPQTKSGVFTHAKPLEQVHLCLGMPGIHQTHPQRHAAYILNTILGGGMSSRLFQEIREKRGKAYSVYSFMSTYSDTGYLGIYAGTSLDWAEEVIDLVLTELKCLAAGEIKVDEVRRTQGQLVGNIMLGLESTDSWMSHIARNELYFGKAITTDEICQRIRSVTHDEIIELARTLFRPEAMAVSLLGDFKQDHKIKNFGLGH
jgi:predicted Zn-dependent peptidase